MSAQNAGADPDSSLSSGSPVTQNPTAIQKINLYTGLPDADIILKSSDDCYFPTFKLLLSMVSEVFRQMFTLPQPESDSTSRPPESSTSADDTLDGTADLATTSR